MRYSNPSRIVFVPVSLILFVMLIVLLGTTSVSAETCPTSGSWPKGCTIAEQQSTRSSSETPTLSANASNICPTTGSWPAGCIPSSNNGDAGRNTTNGEAETAPPCPRNGIWTPGCKPSGIAPLENNTDGIDPANVCPPTGFWPTGCIPRGAPAPKVPPVSTNNSGAKLVIFSIFYNGNVPRIESDERVDIRNVSQEPINLKGYWLEMGDGEKFHFPDYEVRPWQICHVYTNFDKQENCSFSIGSEKPLWDNDGECGRLYDPNDKLISEYCYG